MPILSASSANEQLVVDGAELLALEPHEEALLDFAKMGVIDAKKSGGKFILDRESIRQYEARTRDLGPERARYCWKAIMGNDAFSYFFTQASDYFDMLDIEPVMGKQGYFLMHRAMLKGNDVSLRDAGTARGHYQLNGGLKTPFGFYRLDDGYLFVPSSAMRKKTTYFSDRPNSPLTPFRDNFDALKASQT